MNLYLCHPHYFNFFNNPGIRYNDKIFYYFCCIRLVFVLKLRLKKCSIKKRKPEDATSGFAKVSAIAGNKTK